MHRTALLLFSLLPLLSLGAAPADGDLIAMAENIGRLHNELLDVVGASGALDRGNPDEILEIMVRYTGGVVDAKEIAAMTKSIDPAVLDDRQRRLVEQLGRITADSPSVDVTITRFRAFETALLRRNDLTRDQKQPILIAAVVGRYSAEFWRKASIDPASPYYRFLDPNNPLAIRRPRWLDADVRGAWYVGLNMLPVGVFNPPVYILFVGIGAAFTSAVSVL